MADASISVTLNASDVERGLAALERKAVASQNRVAAHGEQLARRGSAFMGGQNAAYRVGLLSQQAQDITVSLQMGMSASRVIAQQGSQIASVFGPTGMVIGGVIAIGAAIYEWASGTLEAQKQAKEYAELLKEIARIQKTTKEDATSALLMRTERMEGKESAQDLKIKIEHEQKLADLEAKKRLAENAVWGAAQYSGKAPKKGKMEELRALRDAIAAENEKYEEQVALIEHIRELEQNARLNAAHEAYKRRTDELVARANELESKLANPSDEDRTKRMAERVAEINSGLKDLANKDPEKYLEAKNEMLALQVRLMEQGLGTQRRIDKNNRHAADLQKKAMEKEMTAQERLNKLAAEYDATIRKIIASSNEEEKAALRVRAAEVMNEVVGAKRAAGKQAQDERIEKLRRKIEEGKWPLAHLNEVAGDIISGAYTPQALALKRAQERGRERALMQAARMDVMGRWGGEYNKLSGVERQRLIKQELINARAADAAAKAAQAKLDGLKFADGEIQRLTDAIDKLLAK